jgi:hypothetical protein
MKKGGFPPGGQGKFLSNCFLRAENRLKLVQFIHKARASNFFEQFGQQTFIAQ